MGVTTGAMNIGCYRPPLSSLRGMTAPAPPVPPRRPRTFTLNGDERVDEWYGLRDLDEEVLTYLRDENAYTDRILEPLHELREKVFDEIRSRVQETDASAPVPYGPWEYYDRTVEGLQYGIACRRRRGGGDEQIILDENELAAGHDFFSAGQSAISPDHRYLAYTVDYVGNERYALRFRDLETGSDLADEVPNVYYGLSWFDDARTLLYT